VCAAATTSAAHASHLCFAEQPEQFNALVNAFLARAETA
jgi:pimeloyl-ACP methyl ester carboxylesterase